MKLTPEQYEDLLRKHPNLTPHEDSIHSKPKSTGLITKPEQDHRCKSLEGPQDQDRYSGKVQIRYTSFTQRLLDDDNACSKFHTDALRYNGLIEDDRPGLAEITTTQSKVPKGEKPFTLIEITYL